VTDDPINHHPAEALLVDYATGTLPEALALLVGGHLAYCATCRALVDEFEATGGELLRALPPTPVRADALATCLAKLHEPGAAAPPSAPAEVPPALARHAPAGLDALPWQDVGGFFAEAKLADISPGYRTSFIRVPPGQYVPEHDHEGREFMLVLRGGYTSAGKHYARGDVSACAGGELHTPVADAGEDCICLLVLDAPLAFVDAEGGAIAPLLGAP
jgi:putative transcriptional regulator